MVLPRIASELIFAASKVTITVGEKTRVFTVPPNLFLNIPSSYRFYMLRTQKRRVDRILSFMQSSTKHVMVTLLHPGISGSGRRNGLEHLGTWTCRQKQIDKLAKSNRHLLQVRRDQREVSSCANHRGQSFTGTNFVDVGKHLLFDCNPFIRSPGSSKCA